MMFLEGIELKILVDVKENSKSYILVADMPGVKKNNIEAKIKENVLIIKGDKKLDDEKNKDVFGKCSNPNYHGHNYNLGVTITGELNKESGYLIDMKVLSKIMKEEVLIPFDHKNLNLDVPDFKELIPTAENISIVLFFCSFVILFNLTLLS